MALCPSVRCLLLLSIFVLIFNWSPSLITSPCLSPEQLLLLLTDLKVVFFVGNSLLGLALLSASSTGEESGLEDVNGVKDIHSRLVLETVNQVLTEVLDSSLQGSALLNAILGPKKRCNILPLLTFRVNIDDVVEELAVVRDLMAPHHLGYFLSEHQAIVFVLVCIKLHEGLSELLADMLGKLIF